jgi:hypothetical protein
VGQISSVGKRFADPLAIWRQRAEDVRGEGFFVAFATSARCGYREGGC